MGKEDYDRGQADRDSGGPHERSDQSFVDTAWEQVTGRSQSQQDYDDGYHNRDSKHSK